MGKPERHGNELKSYVAQFEQIEWQNAEDSPQSTPAIARVLHLKRTTNLSLPLFSDGCTALGG